MSEQEPAKRLRLKETHPAYKKINKLMELAYSLGITIHFYNNTVSLDINDDDTEYLIEDLEGPSGEWEAAISEFPPVFEYKITMENPKYTEFHKKRTETIEKELEKKRKEDEERRKKAEQERIKAEQERIKKAELKELARLKRKYEK